MSNPCERKLFSLINAQEWHLDRLFAEYTREFGYILRNHTGKISDFKRKQLDRALLRFNNDLEKTFRNQIKNSFTLSNACNDDFIKKYIKDMGVPSEEVDKMLSRNEGAEAAFINRKVKGLGLSERVWKLTKETSESMNILLESGVVDGRSAPEMASDLKQYLKEPNKRFRRVRNPEGKLVLSEPAKRYHPGQGVYRSSYKNALRLSRTEVNMAYRENEFLRRKDLPFVMGQNIRLSPSHPEPDICDALIGRYSKDFKFVGFHPQCLCVSEAVLLPKSKFKEYLAGGSIDNRHLVKGMPTKGLNYLNKNAKQIKGWKNPPYFIRDNFKATDEGFTLKI